MQLMGDHQGDPEPKKNTLTDTNTTEGANLYEIMQGASGEVETAAMMGGKYTATDLQALTGNGAAFLRQLVADLCIWRCYQRRPDWQMPVPPAAEAARSMLNAIASGAAVFPLQENIDAGHLELTRDTPETVESRNPVGYLAHPLFGRRLNRYPLQ